ncbi:DUF4298 domain-containing protein [Streptococcus sp. S784/96/1]|nr:DUF4298 domain-containing protein [Streptococcus sp. S784/96/1]
MSFYFLMVLWYNKGMKEIKKIEMMEQILNQSLEQANRLGQALETTQNHISQLETLFAYYGSSGWRKHIELDEKGKIPYNIPRGVLSEDGIYNAILDYRELAQTMRILADRIDHAILPEE